MELNLYQIDAFADQVFQGNPAAVMPLTNWLPDSVLLAIAIENNLSETAFYVSAIPPEASEPSGTATNPTYHLRWFTPATEVDLCGHATLATAAHLLDAVHPDAQWVSFWTRSGWLRVERGETAGQLVMDLPVEQPQPVAVGDPTRAAALTALGLPTLAGCGELGDQVPTLRATDLIFVVADPETVSAVAPDFTSLAKLPVRGVIVTAPGDLPDVDYVLRWFGAQAGVAEDPVTGSAQGQIAAYWAQRFGRDHLVARQLSARGGTLACQVVGERVRISGSWRRYLTGIATIPDELLH
jgi:PhzF family phenazine biosynthesis protein